MNQRKKPRLRFAERLEELHENDAEDSGQVVALFRSVFLPGLVIVGVAAVVSIFAWLRESLSGRVPLFAGGLIVGLIAALVMWRRSRVR